MTAGILHELSSKQLFTDSVRELTAMQDWQHWSLKQDENGIYWLLFNQKDTHANTLSKDVLEELQKALDTLNSQSPRGLVLRSTKSSGFCAGADINELSELSETEEIMTTLQSAHQVINQLEQVPCPTVAVVHGVCMGGGLELALCCDARIATPGTQLGFPEIQLGLHPGLGGTARLTDLIDPLRAMRLMLTGKPVSADKALDMGLVDEVVEERHIKNAVTTFALNEITGHSKSARERLLTSLVARQVEARQMRSQSAKKLPLKHYPAPDALIDLWENHGGDKAEMLDAEQASFANLLQTNTAQQLIRVFFLRKNMKEITQNDVDPIEQVHVIGAGTMGRDIAAWCAYQGIPVTLADKDPEMIAQAVQKTSQLLENTELRGAQRQQVFDRLIPDIKHQGVNKADLIIEAVPENFKVKQQVYQEIENKMKPDAILATNTSSLPLQTLAEHLQHPERFIGLHFFNPVAKMRLIELVQHPKVNDNTIARGLHFIGQLDRFPAPVASHPGFLVNRVLTPYLLEAMLLMEEGTAPELIDKAAEDFGMPVGPVELADQIGLDICLEVANTLRQQLEQKIAEPPQWFVEKVEKGELGKKSGQGFYQWKGGKPQKKRAVPDVEASLQERLILPMVNSAAACSRDKVIDSDDLLDGAVIFATGFAPYTGGPLNYLDTHGKKIIATKLQTMAKKHGDRFNPVWA